jgi:hypothetical protein
MVKTGLTAGAMAETAYARYLGKKMSQAGDVPVAGGTEPTVGTPLEVEKSQKQLKTLQWAIPGLTGAVLASASLHEEQQRPAQVIKGTLLKVPAMAAAAAAGVTATAKKAS